MTDREHDLKMIDAALRLEQGAVRRYRGQQATTNDPRFYAYLQGLQRNEQGHEDGLAAVRARLAGAEAG